MMYEGRCPHCGNVVRGGHGTPMKRIETPIRTCFRCGHKYTDENMYEWAVLDPVYKFWFYFGANNRGIVLFFSLLLSIAGFAVENTEPALGMLMFSIAWMLICYVYVRIVHKDKIIASYKRCQSAEYIGILNHIKYDKLARKYDSYYGSVREVPSKYSDEPSSKNHYEKYRNDPFAISKTKIKTNEAGVSKPKAENKKDKINYCSKCGNKLPKGSCYCNKCGFKIE